MTTFRTTLQQMVKAENADDRTRLADVLASEWELAMNRAANQTQSALFDVQEAAWRKIDALHEQVGFNNTLLSEVAGALAGMREEAAHNHKEQIAASEANGARLGKLEHDLDALSKRVAAESKRQSARHDANDVDRAALRSEFAEFRTEVHAYMQQLPPAERARIAAMVELHEAELKALREKAVGNASG